MIMEIGIAAGEIWDCLERKGGECLLDVLEDEIAGPKELILMSIGWLAREGHVSIILKDDHHVVRLIRSLVD